MHYCLNCLNGFNTLKARDEHFSYCCNHEAVKINMPKEDEKWISYNNASKEVKKAFTIACDFESIIDKNGKHIPCGYSAVSRCAYGDVPDSINVYRGEDCVENYINYIPDEVQRLYQLFPEKPMLPLTFDEQAEYDKARKCHICIQPFNDLKITKYVIIVISQVIIVEQHIT